MDHFAGAASTIGQMVLPLSSVVWIKAYARTINCPIRPQMWFQGPLSPVVFTEACPESSLYADTLLQTLS